VFFVSDLFVNFATGVEIENRVEMRPLPIAHSYLRSWFIVDFISCLPVEVLASDRKDGAAASGGGGTQLVKLLKLFRLVRMLRMLRLSRIMMRLEYAFSFKSAMSSLCRFGPGLRTALWRLSDGCLAAL
jgi:hyperpolarization activated cyclic nucleotide-gated potassium channel 2